MSHNQNRRNKSQKVKRRRMKRRNEIDYFIISKKIYSKLNGLLR